MRTAAILPLLAAALLLLGGCPSGPEPDTPGDEPAPETPTACESHTDEVAAKNAGLPSVFGHGMFSMGLLGRALTDWAGIGNLAEYRVRFTKQTWPGETLTTKIVVTGKSEGADGKRIAADVSLENQNGEVKLAGSALVAAS